MMARTPADETPFRLAFRTKAAILVEVRVLSLRRTCYDEHSDDEGLMISFGLLT